MNDQEGGGGVQGLGIGVEPPGKINIKTSDDDDNFVLKIAAGGDFCVG